MNIITVSASKTYHVLIGSHLLADLGIHISALAKTGKVAVISDNNVFPLYGDTVLNALSDAGLETCNYVFPAGEQSKNGNTYLDILNFLAENQITRTDLLIALGGGVVGDITGFAAATYLRGIRYVQIPTTLLAMVDSSVGGKTAIDLPSGKNLAGAFYQPDFVLCDIDVLNTLPLSTFQDGCAEVIKYGVLYDAQMFSHLEQDGLNFNRESVISRCVELKRNVVAEDEFDTGARQKLNLGHTIGHGIEAQSNYNISHGQAVATGMAIISKAAWLTGICQESVYKKVIAVLKTFGLPTQTTYSAASLYKSALSDKKRSGGSVNLVIPREIGDCIIQSTAVSELQHFIEVGL